MLFRNFCLVFRKHFDRKTKIHKKFDLEQNLDQICCFFRNLWFFNGLNFCHFWFPIKKKFFNTGKFKKKKTTKTNFMTICQKFVKKSKQCEMSKNCVETSVAEQNILEENLYFSKISVENLHQKNIWLFCIFFNFLNESFYAYARIITALSK